MAWHFSADLKNVFHWHWEATELVTAKISEFPNHMLHCFCVEVDHSACLPPCLPYTPSEKDSSIPKQTSKLQLAAY